MDETTTTPSVEAEQTPSEDTEESSEPTTRAERSERSKEAMNEWLKGAARPPPASQPNGKQASHDATTDNPDEPITLTRAELDRRIQSEQDRREAARNRKEAQTRAQQTEAERLRLLEENPIEGAAQEKQRLLQEQALRTQLSLRNNVMEEYDRTVLDPLFLSLPKSTQNELVKAHGHLTGLESRQAFAKGALDALKAHYLAEGEKRAQAKLRENPAFRKELLGELRGEREEPELVPAARPSTRTSMNDWLLSRRR